MSNWNSIYSQGSIHTSPSEEIIELVPYFKSKNVDSILDAGCGTGRHSKYLAEEGFNLSAIDVSKKAIELAMSNKEELNIDYRVGSLTNLPFSKNSMDVILANHSLEYFSDKDVKKSISNLDHILKKGGIFFARVVSKNHHFYKASPEDIYGFSHVGFCIKNGLPVHFFDENELRNLFNKYKIERLEHISHEIDHEKISVPLKEWVFLGIKK